MILRTQLTVRVHACIGECRLTPLIVANRFTLKPPGREHIVPARATTQIPIWWFVARALCRHSSNSTPSAPPPSFSVSPAYELIDGASCPLAFGAAAGGRNKGIWATAEKSASLMNGKKTGDKQWPMQFPSVSVFFSSPARLGVYIWIDDKSQVLLDDFHSNTAQIFLAFRYDI